MVIGRRRCSDPTLLWPWRRLVATAPIQPLAWELPYAVEAALEKAKRQNKQTDPKINKMDLIKLKSFHTAKETLNKIKRQLIEWEEIFANEVTDKGLISKIYKHLLQLHTKKQTTPSKKGQNI